MTATTQPLHDLGVLVTRPAHQTEGLAAAIEAAGGRAVVLPLLSIEPPADVETAKRQLNAAARCDGWLFTSPNAVRAAAELSAPSTWPRLRGAAGRGTAAALQALDDSPVLVPDDDGAEGLLAMPALQSADAHWAVITGERPLPRLAQGLRARGAGVDVIAVYRRVPVRHAETAVVTALDAVGAAVVSSGESLRHLLALTPSRYRARLLDLQLVVPSERVIELARSSGFRRPPLLPARVGDTGFTQALIRWRSRSTAAPSDD